MPLSDTDALTARVRARLDARLCRDDPAPLAVALSGGGDSVALLALVADWARGNGRRVLALTVDHGLNPASRDWSRRCAAHARAAGADWREVRWNGEKPATGLPAAARAARHALLADAAREAGARVVLLGHTADDMAEGDLIRAEGTPIGRLREWAPSPAWPEGRGLMLLRPLLAERREALRDLLRARGMDWIEDPANADLRFARSRARALGPMPRPEADAGVVSGARRLAALLTCAGGGTRPPRGDRLAAIRRRLAAGEDFDAVLCGARLSARGGRVRVHREAGEQMRGGLAPLRLEVGRAVVWDGRYEVTAHEAGLTVVPARGRLSALSPADRAALAALPAAARGAEPVLIRDGDPRPVLAGRPATVRSLVEARLAAALDATSQEADLIRPRMAPAPPTAYFEIDAAAAAGDRLTERTE